jgi:cytochrome c oxidase subunit 2
VGVVVAIRAERWSPATLVAWGAAFALGLAALLGHALADRPARGPAPEDAMTFRVRAYSWRFELEHENGLTAGELVVPAGRPVRLLVTAEGDPPVVHGLSIPALRVQADAVPGRTTEVWFRATRPGRYPIYCDAFCGVGHSRMRSTVTVMDAEEYDGMSFLTCEGLGRPPELEDDAAWGEALFASNGCVACHDVEPGATGGVGPSVYGVAGAERPLEGGGTALADDAYLERAIVEPGAEVTEGYASVAMPAFHLPRPQLEALLAYLRSLRPAGGAPGPSAAE